MGKKSKNETVCASYQTLGIENIWHLLRKLIWEVKLLQSIPDRIKVGVTTANPLQFQDARLYAQINAVLTVLSLVDWLFHTILTEEIPEERVKNVLGDIELANVGAFRGSMRRQNKLLNACHQIGNANKHLYMFTQATDENFKARPFDIVMHNEDGTIDLATVAHVMSDGIGSVDEMLDQLAHWWYDTLDALQVAGKDQNPNNANDISRSQE